MWENRKYGLIRGEQNLGFTVNSKRGTQPETADTAKDLPTEPLACSLLYPAFYSCPRSLGCRRLASLRALGQDLSQQLGPVLLS